MKEYDLSITFTEPVLASCPANPEVYKEYIASKRRDEMPADEVETLPADKIEERGYSVFHTDTTGVFLMEYHIKGFLKEAATAITGKGITAVKSKLDKWLFVSPRRLYLMNGTGAVSKPDGVLERPVRAMTMQGPRTSLKRSDMVKDGRSLKCGLTVLPLGQKELTEEVLRSWLDYGKFNGLGEWRGGGWGRFSYELTAK